jgi:hypothetical protein
MQNLEGGGEGDGSDILSLLGPLSGSLSGLSCLGSAYNCNLIYDVIRNALFESTNSSITPHRTLSVCRV